MQILVLLLSCSSPEVSKEDIQKTTWFRSGKEVYAQKCTMCHKEDGAGIKGVFPPLKGSQWIQREPELLASIIVRGIGGEITVQGETYRSAMPPQELTAQQTFDVVAYIRFVFAEKEPDFTQEDIERIHTKGGGTIYGEAELYEIFGR